MIKPNLGKKRTCQSCEARFFDLNKNPAICPVCGEKNKISVTKAKRTSPPEQKAKSVMITKVDELAEDAKEEEIVIDRSLEIEHFLWIDEPEYHYDAEKDVHSFNPRWFRRYRPEQNLRQVVRAQADSTTALP